jgi:hypothetical protein
MSNTADASSDGAGDTTIEAEIDRLYGLPLGDFTSTRNELAKSFRRQGDREVADRLKALRKPTVTAWAVNQLVHHYPDLWTDLLETTEGIRDAHATGPDSLAEAMRRRKAALAAALDAAEGVLRRAGSTPGTSQSRRVGGSLEALASGTGEALPGRLVADLDPPGFGGLAGLELVVPRPAPASTKTKPAGKAPRGTGVRPGEGPPNVPGGSTARAPAPERVGEDPEAADAARKAEAAARARAARAVARAEEALGTATAEATAVRAALVEATRQAEQAAAATDGARTEAEEARARFLEAQAAQAGLERRARKLEKERATAERSEKEARTALEKARSALDEA